MTLELLSLDENDNVISGFQRAQIMADMDPDQLVDCKVLVGYTEKEKKTINIKANQHAGEWDIDALVDFAIDLTDIDLATFCRTYRRMTKRT